MSRINTNVAALTAQRGLHRSQQALSGTLERLSTGLKINPRLTSSLYGRGIAKQRNGSAQEGALDIANAKAMDPNIVQEFASYGVR